LALTFFLPFVDWPSSIIKARWAHLLIGAVYSYAVFQPQGDFTFNESVVVGLLWLTLTLSVAIS